MKATTEVGENENNKKEQEERGEQATQRQNDASAEKGHGEMPRIGNKQEEKTTEQAIRKHTTGKK